MEKIRACQLLKGDTFEMWGHRFKVKEIRDGRIYYRYVQESGYGGDRGGGADSIGIKSQLFVNFIQHGTFKDYKRHSGKVVPGKGTCDGSGPTEEYDD
jgi:hypothetical protein